MKKEVNQNTRAEGMHPGNDTDNSKKDGGKERMTSRQIVALVGVALLVLLYLAALVAAFFDNSASGRLFWACLFATIAVPLLIWIYTWIYGKLTGRRTPADFSEEASEKEE